MQQIASVCTPAATLRSTIDGWSFEDASLLVHRRFPENRKLCIGLTPSPKDIPYYTCCLEMVADGWELLGPPQREEWTSDDGLKHEQWHWWLKRACPVRK